MALNASGPISLGGSTSGQSINLELGLSATAAISLNAAAVRTLLGKASGLISLSDAYGKSNAPPIAVDSTAYASNYPGNQSFYHTISSNAANAILVVCVTYVNANGCTGVTYNGDAMTEVVGLDPGDYVNAKIFVKSSPYLGTANVTVQGGGMGAWAAYSIAFTGASGYSATASSRVSNYAQPSLGLTTNYNNSYVVSCVSQADVDPGNVVSGMTKIGPNQYYYSHTGGGAYRFAATAGSTTNAWTDGGDTNGSTMLGVEITAI